MLQTLRKRFERDEEGFTLIELMVVVLIIAILLAIAIPTFLGARERAQDRAAQSNIRNAYTAGKTIYTDTQDWSAVTESSLKAAEPSLNFVVGAQAASTTEKQIAFTGTAPTASPEQAVFAALAKTNRCFLLKEVTKGANAGTTYAKIENAASSCAVNANVTYGDKW